MFSMHLREYSPYLAAAGAAGLSIAVIYPDMWGVMTCKKKNQACCDGDGEPVSIDANSLRIQQEFFDTVLWNPTFEAHTDIFTVKGLDLLHRGSTFINQGGIVGLPVHFRYTTMQEVDINKIYIENHPIDWESHAGQDLRQSLVLSDNARRFAIARELFYIYTVQMYVRCVCVGIFSYIAICLGYLGNVGLDLSRRPLVTRIVVYSLCAIIVSAMYRLVSDLYGCYRDRSVDRQASNMGLEYAEGGEEFYSKLLQRNAALRILMGTDGERKYTAYGNDVHNWSSPSVPLTDRREAMVSKVKAFRSPSGITKKSTIFSLPSSKI